MKDALKKFKEDTGYDFMELIRDDKKVKEFFDNCKYDDIYLKDCEELIVRIKEIKNDLGGK